MDQSRLLMIEAAAYRMAADQRPAVRLLAKYTMQISIACKVSTCLMMRSQQ